MSFRKYFGLGVLLVILIAALLLVPKLFLSDPVGFPENPLLGMSMVLGMFLAGPGGAMASVLCFFTHVGWRESEMNVYNAHNRWRKAAWASPLALCWTGAFVLGFLTQPNVGVLGRVLGVVFFGIPFLVILVGSIRGIAGDFAAVKLTVSDRIALRRYVEEHQQW